MKLEKYIRETRAGPKKWGGRCFGKTHLKKYIFEMYISKKSHEFFFDILTTKFSKFIIFRLNSEIPVGNPLD